MSFGGLFQANSNKANSKLMKTCPVLYARDQTPDGEDVHPEAAADRQTQTKMNAIRRHK